jgi:hypothetical protein
MQHTAGADVEQQTAFKHHFGLGSLSQAEACDLMPVTQVMKCLAYSPQHKPLALFTKQQCGMPALVTRR